jgi:hypothetical protein
METQVGPDLEQRADTGEDIADFAHEMADIILYLEQTRPADSVVESTVQLMAAASEILEATQVLYGVQPVGMERSALTLMVDTADGRGFETDELEAF